MERKERRRNAWAALWESDTPLLNSDVTSLDGSRLPKEGEGMNKPRGTLVL